MKLKVIREEDTPKSCTRRVVLSHDDGYHEWVRNDYEMMFLMWQDNGKYSGDKVLDKATGKMVDVPSPFEDVLDEDGNETGKRRLMEGLIAFPVDMIEHGSIAWSLGGEGGPGFYQPFDSTRNAYWLYADKSRWDRLCGNCKWEFVDGKPTEALLKEAIQVARSEIEMMNLSEQGSYFSYREEVLVRTNAHAAVEVDWMGKSRKVEHPETETWEGTDNECCGFLTDKPAEDVDFPPGRPVVTDYEYAVGDTFEQECWALSDDITGKFMRVYDYGKKYELVDDPEHASVCGYNNESYRKAVEDEFKRALTYVDVTERIWSKYPECHA